MNLTLWRIGWRGLRRYPQRAILMLAIVAFGSALIRDVRTRRTGSARASGGGLARGRIQQRGVAE